MNEEEFLNKFLKKIKKKEDYGEYVRIYFDKPISSIKVKECRYKSKRTKNFEDFVDTVKSEYYELRTLYEKFIELIRPQKTLTAFKGFEVAEKYIDKRDKVVKLIFESGQTKEEIICRKPKTQYDYSMYIW